MKTNVACQPIMDAQRNLLGYELLYQQRNGGPNSENEDAAGAIESFLMEFNNDLILDGGKAFVTFTPDLLLKDVASIFGPAKLVIQIDDATTVNPMAQKMLRKYRENGYEIAIKDFEFSVRYFSLMDIVDYLKVDMQKCGSTEDSVTKIGAGFHKKIIAYNINTAEECERAKGMGCDYLQGTAVAAALSSHTKRLNHLQSNFFQLMVAVTKDEPDVDEIAQIISRDVTLTFSLLRLVNSAYFALRNRVNSVKQALVVLGLGQLKQWIYLLSFRNGNDDDVPKELIKTSFQRASFCSELAAHARGLALAKSDAYLLGMFSTLGQLLDIPLEQALAELPVLDDIKEALISRTGACAPLYDLVLSYEAADWTEMTKYAAQLDIPEHIVAQKYFECIESVNGIWNGLMQPAQG